MKPERAFAPAFNREEMDGLFLTLIEALSRSYDRSNPSGRYRDILDPLAQLACGGQGSIDRSERLYFQERVMATISRGIGDNSHEGTVDQTLEDPRILVARNYRPFRTYVNLRDGHGYRLHVRSRSPYPELMLQIDDDQGPSFYCKVLGPASVIRPRSSDDVELFYPGDHVIVPRRDVCFASKLALSA